MDTPPSGRTPEREDTDLSLREEREKTDLELSRKRVARELEEAKAPVRKSKSSASRIPMVVPVGFHEHEIGAARGRSNLYSAARKFRRWPSASNATPITE